jgi:hypothetical protein
MQMRNLIVPVVGNFAGPKAVRAVGDYLKQRSLIVQAFYLSNVEQYLFGDGIAGQFYENVSALPLDSASSFIRSIPPNAAAQQPFAIGRFSPGSGNSSVRISVNGGVTNLMQTFDSAGLSWVRMTRDSAGIAVSRLYRDSSGVLTLRRTDSTRGRPGTAGGSVPMPNIFVPFSNGNPNMPVVGMPSTPPQFVMGSGGMLVSGLAPMLQTVEEYKAGRITAYRDVIAMTKLDNWK